MSSKKLRPEEMVRRQVRQSHRLQIEREMNARLAAGQYPFEGGWCTLGEIEAKRREMKRSDRIVFAELVVLLFILLAGGLFPILLLTLLLP